MTSQNEDEKLAQLLKQLKMLDQAEKIPKEQSMNEEGLPIMEIREELDEEGNVISHQVEPQKNTDVKELADQLTKMVQDYEKKASDARAVEARPKEQAQIAEPSKESPIPAEQPSSSGTTPQAPSHWKDLNPSDLLELELIADEIEDDDELQDIDEEDEEEAYDEDDDDDEDDEDEDKYGRTRGTLFPFPLTPSVQASLRASSINQTEASDRPRRISFSDNVEVKTYWQNQKPEKTAARSTKTVELNDNLKSVSFADTVQVKTFEAPIVEIEEDEEETKQETEKAPIAPWGTQENNVMERWEEPEEVLEEKSSKPARKVSKFKSTMRGTPVKPQIPVVAYDNQPTETIAFPAQATGIMSEDVLELARENMAMATMTDEDFIKAHDDDTRDNDELVELETSPSEEEPVTIVDSIVENIVEFNDDDDEGDLDIKPDENANPTRQELAQEYQRLRRKIIDSSGGFGKSEEERAVDAVDETGEPKKVSRFKAAMVTSHVMGRSV